MAEQEIGFRRLRVWVKSDELVHEIYRVTRVFPPEELYGITSQLRRAALSVPLNIVEGYARQTDKSFANFIAISYGSLMEVEYLLELARDLRFFEKNDFDRLYILTKTVARSLWQLKRQLERV